MRFHDYESESTGNQLRLDYRNGMEAVVEQRRKRFDALRAAHCADIMENPERHRRELVHLLGWPLTEYEATVPNVRCGLVAEAEGILISRIQFEVLPGLWAGGIFFRQQGSDRRPLFFSLHGGGGTPELASGLLKRGSGNYNAQTERILSLGAHVFAPQLLLWSAEVCGGEEEEWKDADRFRHSLDAKLRLLGGSIAALEITCMRRELDYFVRQSYVDAARIGIVGLSYGGFYAMHLAAVETRFRAILTSCAFNDRYVYSWPDLVWRDAGQKLEDAEVALLTYPRRLIVQVGEKDALFKVEGARREMERVRNYCKGKEDWLKFSVFPGAHEQNPNDDDLKDLFCALG